MIYRMSGKAINSTRYQSSVAPETIMAIGNYKQPRDSQNEGKSRYLVMKTRNTAISIQNNK